MATGCKPPSRNDDMILTTVTVRGTNRFSSPWMHDTSRFASFASRLGSLHFYDCFPIRLLRPIVVTLATRDTGLAQDFPYDRKKHASRKWQKWSIFCCPCTIVARSQKISATNPTTTSLLAQGTTRACALDLYPYLDGAKDIDILIC